MTHLNRSLIRVGVFSVLLGLTQVAQAGPIQVDTTIVRKDTVALVPTVADTLLRVRLAALQKDIPLTYHKAVQAYVDYYTFRKASTTKRMLERMPLFFPLYERMLAQYELPDELKYLSIVESALNPRAISHAGAGGLWQFMPGTGRDMRLHQDEYVDERMDPVKATEAACKYLRDLYNIFGDWELSLAAYNCGPGSGSADYAPDGGNSFYTIYDALPKETRGYVPQFVAFTYLMHHANDHGIAAETFDYPIPSDTIHVSGYFNLETFAKHSTIPLANLQKMNPAIVTTILPEYTSHYPLRVPREQYPYFAARRRAILDSAGRLPVAMANVLLAHAEPVQYGDDSAGMWASLNGNPLAHITFEETPAEVPATTTDEPDAKAAKLTAQLAVAEPADESAEDMETVVLRKPRKQTYVVKRGDNLNAVADRLNVEVYDLKRWNRLRSSTLRRGQNLVVFKEVAETRTDRLADQGTTKSRRKAEQALAVRRFKPRYHRVQDGDTLWNITQRYDGLTIDRLKKLNNIRSSALRRGQKLIVG